MVRNILRIEDWTLYQHALIWDSKDTFMFETTLVALTANREEAKGTDGERDSSQIYIIYNLSNIQSMLTPQFIPD